MNEQAPQLTDAQARGFAAAVAELNARQTADYVIPDDPHSHEWRLRWGTEMRPGRGATLSGVWISPDRIVQLIVDRHGRATVAYGEVEWVHSDGDEGCTCGCREEQETTS